MDYDTLLFKYQRLLQAYEHLQQEVEALRKEKGDAIELMMRGRLCVGV